MSNDYLRGHEIEETGSGWVYSDTKESTVGNHRGCGHCGMADTHDGYDGCLGRLRGVMNACCGHGIVDDAYVQFADGSALYGGAAIEYFKCAVEVPDDE